MKRIFTLSLIAGVAAIYFLAGRFGLSLAFVHMSASAVWPPSGIALAAVLLLGYRVWPGIFIGAFLVNFDVSGSVLASLPIATGNTLEALLGAYLINRFANGHRAFERARDIFKFIVLAASVSTAVSATIGTTSLMATGLAEWNSYMPIWLTWWLGDATGDLIVAPAILLWATNWKIHWHPKRALEFAALMTATVTLGAAVFGGLSYWNIQNYSVGFLLLPLVIWFAFQFSGREASTVTLLLSAIAIWGTTHGFGPFAAMEVNESLLLLQIFSAIVAMTSLVFAAIIAEQRRAETALRESEEHYRIVTETATDVVVTMDVNSTITFISTAAEKVFGYPSSELIGRSLTALMPAAVRDVHSAALARYLKTGKRHIPWTAMEIPGLHRLGYEIPLEISFGEFKQDGKHLLIGIMRDVTERKRAEEAQHWLATIVESTSDAVIGKTLDGTILSWNHAAEQMYGYTAKEAIGHPITMLAPPERHAEVAQFLIRIRNGERIQNYETERVRKDGKRLYVSLTISPIKDAAGAIRGASAIARDITDRKRAEERIRYLAQHDSLTGLPNRNLFRDRIGQVIVHARRAREQVAVLFLDLDGFKHINDSLGHQIGDRLLRMAARRLQGCLREGDTVARLGGDEFILSLPGLADSNDAILISNKILEALREPFLIEQHELHLTGSIGISLYPADGEDVETLLRAADTAMYHAKEKGRDNYQFFTAHLNDAARRRLNIANRLHRALENNEFSLYYQPEIHLGSGRVFAAEALVRWRRPELGLIAPNEFIKVAEETGLIVPLGEWALREAAGQLRQWHDAGFPDLRMTVNLSPQQLRRPGFVELVKAVLQENRLSPTSLDLEITEGILMAHSQENLHFLQQLSDVGVRLVVDDFGVGYSSLGYLQRFPIHALKIDQSFVNGVGLDPNDTALVTAIIAIAHSLNLEVVAEGVESEEQATFLRAHGCEAAQGFYYSQPISAEAFIELLRTRTFSTSPASGVSV